MGGIWQGHQESNSGHAVLETAALPAELYPYLKDYEAQYLQRYILYHKKNLLSTAFCNFFLFTKRLSRNKRKITFPRKTSADWKKRRKIPMLSQVLTKADSNMCYNEITGSVAGI